LQVPEVLFESLGHGRWESREEVDLEHLLDRAHVGRVAHRNLAQRRIARADRWIEDARTMCSARIGWNGCSGPRYQYCMRTDRPPFIVSSADVAEKSHRYPNSDEDMAPARAIGRAAGLLRIGIHLVRVPPGKRTSYPHAESA